MHILIVKISVPGFVLPKAIISFFLYFTTDSGNDSFLLPLPTWYAFTFKFQTDFFDCQFCGIFRIPFNYKIPIGYPIAVALQFMMVLNPLRYIAFLVSLGAGSYVLACVLCNRTAVLRSEARSGAAVLATVDTQEQVWVFPQHRGLGPVLPFPTAPRPP